MPSGVALVCFLGGVLSYFEPFIVAYGKMFWSSESIVKASSHSVFAIPKHLA